MDSSRRYQISISQTLLCDRIENPKHAKEWECRPWRLDAKMISWPSSVQLIPLILALSTVRRRASPPAIGMMYRSAVTRLL
jgi:hypothetical protein